MREGHGGGTFVPLNIVVLTVSDSRTLETDRSGALLAGRLAGAGHQLVARDIVRDDLYRIRALVAGWIADAGIDVVLITGGTGFAARDITPDAVVPLLDKLVDGFGELFRALSREQIGTATIQSRALAGLANGTLVCCLPGSPGACALAWDAILNEQLDGRNRPCNFAQVLRPGGNCPGE